MSNISVLGIGLMGEAIARTLLRTGHSVTVWNRTPDRCARLADAGARVADSSSHALNSASLAIAVGTPYDVLVDMIDAGAARPELVVVNLTTGNPLDADHAHEQLRQRDLGYLDGAIYSYPGGIGEEETAIFYAGDSDAWGAWELLLKGLGGASEYLGTSARLANSLDLVMLSYTSVAQLAMLEATALGDRLGLPAQVVLDQLARSAQTPAEFARYVSPMIAADHYVTRESTVSTWHAAIEGVASVAAGVGLDARQVVAAVESLRAARDAGLDGLDLASLYSLESQSDRAVRGSE